MKEKPLVFLLTILSSVESNLSVGIAQEGPPDTRSSEITLRASSNLVLVDVIATRNGLPESTLKQNDFRIFDNNRLVPIKTFDTGVSARPLALWFVVLCNMQGYEKEGSGLFAGQIGLFRPALKNVEKQDTVAVAHWCDNGESKLDLLPTGNIEEAVTVLEQVLLPIPDTNARDRTGELALQKTLQLIIDATRSSRPEPLPVLIFIYGDHSGMPRQEANHFIDDLLETSAIAFGVRDRRSPNVLFLIDEQKHVARYVAAQTGGRYYNATPDTYARALEDILRQLHLRYELAFKPEVLDGKRHNLRVELTDSARKQHKDMRLRYRTAYVPVPSQPNAVAPGH